MLIHSLLATWIAVQPAPANVQALIDAALDEPIQPVRIEGVSLHTAIDLLTEQTGVTIRMSPEVMGWVPDGADLPIDHVELANITLREGLARFFGHLGMTFVVRSDHVEVVPKAALRCLGRLPAWEEIVLLGELESMSPGTEPEHLADLRSRMQFHVREPNTWDRLAEAIRNVGAGAGDEVLTLACDQLGWGWCLSGEHIVITPIAERVRRQLQRPIALRINHRPLFDVMSAVGRGAGVTVRAEPGALASLPMHMRQNFSLNVYGQTAEQALETIAAYTGLGYYLEPDGVRFYAPDGGQVGESAAADTTIQAGTGASDPYVASISVVLDDGRSVRWLIRASELPPDLRDRRAIDIKAAFDALRGNGQGVSP